MATLPVSDSSIDLRAVTVRPTWGAQEHRRWDRLVEQHHYLAFHGVIGKGLRHVAVHGETWLALIGWQPGAFKLGARDRWIGWSAEQQFRRLHLIANNSRFVILTPGRVPNLASRVLGLSLRRLSEDIQAVHGYPALLAETFVDVSRFAGTCYRASNWRSLGLTRGFAREPERVRVLGGDDLDPGIVLDRGREILQHPVDAFSALHPARGQRRFRESRADRGGDLGAADAGLELPDATVGKGDGDHEGTFR